MQLLTALYSIHAPTGSEWEMIRFIRDFLKKEVPEASCQMDGWGNLYITKGKASGYPTLACHMDQVQTLHSPDFEVRQDGDILYGWSESGQHREGLGADDKNGIWICLQCLKKIPCLKVFMSVGEEKGCIGSNRADRAFFSDSFYVIEPDSKEGGEVKVLLRGIPCASEEFVTALETGKHGFSVVEGKTTDILPLTLSGIGVSCANISAGYYDPHKDDEYTVVSDLRKSLEYVEDILGSLQRRFPHTYKTETQRMVAGRDNETKERPRLYVDMDGVLADFDSGINRLGEEVKKRYAPRLKDVPGVFSLMDPVPGAIEALGRLSERFEIYILSTAPWSNPTAWSDKVNWIKTHLDGRFEKRLILCHHKELLANGKDYMIEDGDGIKHGARSFGDKWIRFGSPEFPDWNAVETYLEKESFNAGNFPTAPDEIIALLKAVFNTEEFKAIENCTEWNNDTNYYNLKYRNDYIERRLALCSAVANGVDGYNRLYVNRFLEETKDNATAMLIVWAYIHGIEDEEIRRICIL